MNGVNLEKAGLKRPLGPSQQRPGAQTGPTFTPRTFAQPMQTQTASSTPADPVDTVMRSVRRNRRVVSVVQRRSERLQPKTNSKKDEPEKFTYRGLDIRKVPLDSIAAVFEDISLTRICFHIAKLKQNSNPASIKLIENFENAFNNKVKTYRYLNTLYKTSLQYVSEGHLSESHLKQAVNAVLDFASNSKGLYGLNTYIPRNNGNFTDKNIKEFISSLKRVFKTSISALRDYVIEYNNILEPYLGFYPSWEYFIDPNKMCVNQLTTSKPVNAQQQSMEEDQTDSLEDLIKRFSTSIIEPPNKKRTRSGGKRYVRKTTTRKTGSPKNEDTKRTKSKPPTKSTTTKSKTPTKTTKNTPAKSTTTKPKTTTKKTTTPKKTK